jgi:penicillin-binding protein 1A
LPDREEPPTRTGPPGGGGSNGSGGGSGEPGDDGGRRRRPRVRKLRFLLILLGLMILAVISTCFGMMMAVASDIPLIENQTEYKSLGKNSYLYDDHWRPIGPVLARNPEVIDTWQQISPAAVHAVLAVEDKRYWQDPGVDLKGIIRAFVSDVGGGPTQGASTITEQFVKNALNQQGNRTILEKLREAALAFHLTQKWSRTKILTEYLNSVYFGNGAYGIESAARTYFGNLLGYDPNAPADGNRTACGDATAGLEPCAKRLVYWQAALLAGMIADPSAFDPITHRTAAIDRRNLVLLDMLQQGYIPRWKYELGIRKPVPKESDLEVPSEPAAAPYFASWLEPQITRVLERLGMSPTVAQYRAYYGGLKIRTTLDLQMQQAADRAIYQTLPYNGPSSPVASLVTIDNRTGEVRAMVGGPVVSDSLGNLHEDYSQFPFNLATEAQRQPGSAFKPFTLAVALESGFGPSSVLLSAPANFVVPRSGGKEIFHVKNFGNTYSGDITLQEATDISDNSVFSRLGIQGLGRNGTSRIARMARRAGIRTPVSTNYAMILGGLRVGVSPLDMAHAYETFADGGKRMYNPILGDAHRGPTGIAEVQCPHSSCGGYGVIHDTPLFDRVLPPGVAHELHQMLMGPVQSGTATAAAISGVSVAGKTGTTTNYADAWFVGWTPQLTTAVWVGYPSKLIPMTTLFNGGPVEGGTFPAVIWHAFMLQALQILASERPANAKTATTTSTVTVPTVAAPSSTTITPATTPAATTPATTTGAGTAAGGGGATTPAPTAPANQTTPGAGGGGTGGGTNGTGTGTGSGSGSGSGGSTGGAGVGGGG